MSSRASVVYHFIIKKKGNKKIIDHDIFNLFIFSLINGFY